MEMRIVWNPPVRQSRKEGSLEAAFPHSRKQTTEHTEKKNAEIAETRASLPPGCLPYFPSLFRVFRGFLLLG
jgi:hypothetical protein